MSWYTDETKNNKARFIWCDLPDGMPVKVATVHRNERIAPQEFDTNTRLITIAPELLEALRILCKDRAITRATDEAFEARNTARKLIAAIDGK
ncbi:MAG: hypothetical protein IJS28_06960 [Synergistaceae bacterium]|nr:hypothetical protein [Synergistaceae bacterium]